MSAALTQDTYPARFDVEYTEHRNRLTVLFRAILGIPIFVIVALVGGANLAFATALMLLFRRRYPQPWFQWALYLQQLSLRATAYAMLLVDEYPSTTDQQRVLVEADLDETRLSRWMPLVKWFLAIPHYVVLVLLWIAVALLLVLAWFIILVTGRFPRGMFNFVVGVLRWGWRETAYVSLLSTDHYPPFSLR